MFCDGNWEFCDGLVACVAIGERCPDQSVSYSGRIRTFLYVALVDHLEAQVGSVEEVTDHTHHMEGVHQELNPSKLNTTLETKSVSSRTRRTGTADGGLPDER